jgi:beta-mannosidase
VTLVGSGDASAAGGDIALIVPAARLWWPRGHGDQALYDLAVSVTAGGVTVARATRRVGLRTVALSRRAATGREGFELVINGRPIYVLGTNYIPVDYLKVHGTPEDYARIFDLLVHGHNNLVRMWGGGAPESTAFYEECDRRGLMLWQDCYLHSNTYPDYDPEWVASFREECRQILHDVREHPCLVMVAGGNEQYEGWDEWQWKDTLEYFFGERLVTELIPELIATDVPVGVPYIVNTPHSGLFCQSPVQGESHTWGHFFTATKDPVFVTETCWGQDSYSRPETLAEVMDLDVDEVTGPTWTARWKALTSLGVIHRFHYTGYHNTGGLRPYLLGLEVEQAEADYQALKHFRLRSPSNRGIVYWSFNKGGPLFQFGAVDYRLRPLMSHYVVARLYRPVAVGVYRDLDDICVVASNASPTPAAATVEVDHLDAAGAVLGHWEAAVTVPPGAPVRLLEVPGLYRDVKDRLTEVVVARLVAADGAVLSDDRFLFCPLAEYRPPRPEVGVTAERAGEGWTLTLEAAGGVAKMVRLEDDARLLYSDNYFLLAPGRPKTVAVTGGPGVTGGPATVRVSVLDHAEVTEVELA